MIVNLEETFIYQAIQQQMGAKDEELLFEFVQSVTDHLLFKVSHLLWHFEGERDPQDQ